MFVCVKLKYFYDPRQFLNWQIECVNICVQFIKLFLSRFCKYNQNFWYEIWWNMKINFISSSEIQIGTFIFHLFWNKRSKNCCHENLSCRGIIDIDDELRPKFKLIRFNSVKLGFEAINVYARLGINVFNKSTYFLNNNFISSYCHIPFI